ncbi:PREDICTED: uncharacterized protein LOC109186416 [Ipomoea nil]|uniref:uncharacterized protein LOC109186416 n=1 Tax=Ipomoea nil TaxID=35883 RepID=UPI0009010B71|nr:PREDICTED: uncharacterized protein LOC109186416 [Ipomoea nil]
MNRSYLPWPPPLPPPSAGRLRLPATENPQEILASQRHKFTCASLSRSNWKPKKPYKVHAAETSDFQQASRYNKKGRRFFQKKRQQRESCDFEPFTPHNTTSFLIRAKRSGGIASLVSPYPVTPSVLPTPKFSPSREVLAEVAKEEWGVDGYGSMNGLIRLRSPENGAEGEGVIDSCESEVEKRLSHDLNRFEMIYDPNYGNGNQNRILYNVDGVDEHIERLEEENMVLKERIYIIEKELGELRRRMLCFEAEDENGESENDVGGGGSEGSVGD